MNEVINDLYGEELIKAMNHLIDEFLELNFDSSDVLKSLKNINESVRIGIYFLALERQESDMAYKINKANKRLNEIRKEKFIEAYNNDTVSKYLKKLGKVDKISLMEDLNVDVPVNERVKLSKKQREYYRIISESIMNDQVDDNRDGIDTFITYKKDEKA